MRRKEYEKAFQVFNLRPGLTECMRINEISGYYESFRRNLGEGYADGLKIAVSGAFERIGTSIDRSHERGSRRSS
jgi:hypothetical protein